VGVDIVYCSGCYECTELFSPQTIRELFFPFHRKTVRMIDQAGAKFHYYTITGVMELLADYKEMGFHILSSLDPMGSGGELRLKAVDLAVAKREIGDKVCLWGGVDPERTIELGTRAGVRDAVRHAIITCGPGGGFVLSLAGDIRRENTCDERVLDNVRAFVEAGREFGHYPIGTG
jgi:uroporphyrinogen decarboxylase